MVSRQRIGRALLGALGLVAAAHCGGKAVIDGSAPGSGGSGASGGSDPGTTTTTATASTTSTTTTPPTPANTELCDALCEDLSLECLVTPGCSAACQYAAPACSQLHGAWLQCLYAEGLFNTVCDPSGYCEPELLEWYACAVQEVPMGCEFADDGSCTCTIEQSGGAGSSYQTHCYEGMYSTDCECSIDGAPVGTCHDAKLPGQACHVVLGCCGALFYVPFGTPPA